MDKFEQYYSIPDRENNKYTKLLYSRGFLLSDMPYTVKDDWKTCNFFENLYITHDPRVECVCVKNDASFVLILGTVMDTIDWHMEMSRVAKKCLSALSVKKELFYDYLDYLCGRHLICFGNKTKQYVLQDATGVRSCFFAQNHFLAASHYGIINDIIHDEHHPFMEKFLNMEKRPRTLPGNITPFKNIMALTPNHELCLNDRSLKRFWPRKPHEDISAETAMDYIVDNLQKQVTTLSRYHKLMFQMTKGNDSRMALALSKPVKDISLYYTFYEEKNPLQKTDAEFTARFLEKLGLNYLIVNYKIPEDRTDDYKMLCSVMRYSHYVPSASRMVFYYADLFPDDMLNIRSNLVEIIRYWGWQPVPKETGDDYKIEHMVGHELFGDDEAREIIREYFYSNELNKLYNYNLTDVIYWEYRMALWINASVVAQDDLSYDTYMLFNQRKILEYGLSMPRYFKNNNLIIERIILNTFPEVIEPLPNTDYRLMDYFSHNDLNKVQIRYNSKIESNLPEKELYSALGRYNATFGFGKNSVKKGDFVELAVKLNINSGFMCNIQVHIICNTADNLYNMTLTHYDVFLDEEKVYSLKFSNFLNKVNQIDIFKKFNVRGEHWLKIRVCADDDISDGFVSAGIIHIEGITCCSQKNYKKSEKTIVTSTSEMYNTLNLK